MKDFEKRLLEEHAQLRDRVDNLKKFLLNLENVEKFNDPSDWNDLCVQRDIMIAYLGILENRIIKLGLVVQDGSKYELTEKGKKLYSHLKPKKELTNVIEDFKEFLNDLPDNEILAFVYVTYPDYISESAKWDELKKDRVRLAISLLRKEKISFGKAVEISGLKSKDFEDFLKKRGIKWRK